MVYSAIMLQYFNLSTKLPQNQQVTNVALSCSIAGIFRNFQTFYKETSIGSLIPTCGKYAKKILQGRTPSALRRRKYPRTPF